MNSSPPFPFAPPPPSSPSGGCEAVFYEELMGWLGCGAAWVLFLVPM